MMASEEKHIDVERFRSPFESNTEWRVRKKFLTAHLDKFDEARLVCLSQCYLNSRQMGCLYPPEVMKQLNALAVDIGEDNYSDITNLPSKIKGMEPVKFVRSGDGTGSSSTSSHQTSFSNTGSHGPSPPKKTVYGSYGMGFVKSSSEYKSTDVAMHEDQNPTHKQAGISSSSSNPFRTKRSKGSGLGFGTSPYCTTGINDMDFKFQTLSNAIKDLKVKFGKSKNSIELLQMGVDKAKMAMDCSFKDIIGAQYTHTFVCTILIDFVQAGIGKGSNKKSAKHTAFDDALAKLSCTNVYVDQSDSEKPVLMSSNQQTEFQPQYYQEPVSYEPEHDQGMNLYESNFNSISVVNKQKPNSLNGDVTRFIIFENFSLQTSNAMSILRQSSDINKALLEFQYGSDSYSPNTNCQIYIEGQFIAEMFAVGKENAKTLAAMEALEVLRKMCWTIKIKQGADCPIEEMLSRDEVMGDIQREAQKAQTISNDNVGSKLLQKMGWCGGGIGAEGNIGRAEPVAVSMEQIINREGLGLHTADGMKNFRKNINKVVEDYVKSETQDDLKFTSDFTKEERAYIHTFSQRLGLKSTSRGKGDDRYLTLSRKRTANQLFDHVMNEGGSTHKYDLIPPGGES